MKFYITFGQSHSHAIADRTYDRNCVAEISAENRGVAQNKAFDLFGAKWANIHAELPDMRYYPRGIIKV